MFTKGIQSIGNRTLSMVPQFRMLQSSEIRSRRFSSKAHFENSSTWVKMSDSERMNCALAESDPQTAKMAYYRGKGLFEHRDFNGAISAFERAAELDASYTAPSNEAIAIIYNQVGNKDAAFDQLFKAYRALAVAKANPLVLDILDTEIGITYIPYKGLA